MKQVFGGWADPSYLITKPRTCSMSHGATLCYFYWVHCTRLALSSALPKQSFLCLLRSGTWKTIWLRF